MFVLHWLPQRSHRGSTEIPQRFHRGSTEVPQRFHRGSTEVPQRFQVPQRFHRGSTEVPQRLSINPKSIKHGPKLDQKSFEIVVWKRLGGILDQEGEK